jgi:hypothetical protein
MHNDFYRIHLEETRKRKEGRMRPSSRCPSCGANLEHIAPWGWPHFCKETTYGIPVTPTITLPLSP